MFTLERMETLASIIAGLISISGGFLSVPIPGNIAPLVR